MENFTDLVNDTNNNINGSGGIIGNDTSGPPLDYDPQYYLGPVRDPLYVVVPISVIYASIFVTGTVGNISTCIVIARNKSMHTATNYYLFSLAVSDLLLLVCGMPTEIYQVWSKYPYVFGEVFCVARGLASETSTNASVLTITAFTAERYVAICHPFLAQTMSKLSRAVKLILVVWLIALLCALPQALQFGVVQSRYIAEDVRCQVVRVIVRHSFELSSFLFFVVPMTVIMVLYVLIGLKLKRSTMMKSCGQLQGQQGLQQQQQQRRKRWRRSEGATRVKVGNSRMDRHGRHGRSTRRVLKMLVAVVVAFFICWAPFHMQRLIAIYGEAQKTPERHWIELVYVIFTYGSGVLYYFSTTINPILYNIMSNKFREAFMETLARSCRMTRLVVPRERRSYSSLSRSQQRNLGVCTSRMTAVSGIGTGLAQQESTDCSGNSFREEHQPEARRASGLVAADLASPRTPTALTYDEDADDAAATTTAGASKQSSVRSVVTVDVAAATAKCPRFIEITRQHQQQQKGREKVCSELMPSSPGYETQGSPTKSRVQHESSGRRAAGSSKQSSTKKKWWRLLDWLPGLKSFRRSRGAAQSGPDDAIDMEQRRTPRDGGDGVHRDEQQHVLQLHALEPVKDESTSTSPTL